MEVRQLLEALEAAGTPRLANRAHLCQPINLPVGGVLISPGGEPVTLTAPAAFRPACTAATQPNIIAGNGGTSLADLAEVAGNSGINVDAPNSDIGPQFSDFRDPFYASTFPQCYALAATTVIAYTLVIMLFITPRSFLDGGVVVLGRRGFTNGGGGGTNIGGRPWLQKVAALTVAISLTIATADTFRAAEEQYSWGIQNAPVLQQEVLGGTQLKVIRIISDTFLWLAQAQTLIRLFPRQREKIIIKWTAFSLITLDLVFDSLNSFLYTSAGRTFTDAIPALSYLFQLSLGVLYAAWVIYYALMKKRYAFYHPQMRNMCLVAALSLIALLVPVVFFVLDISKPDVTGWGDYVRWVGAAAASVIVWEWVERIEALEREEKKDGILGREVFDGDEMLEESNSSDFNWPRKRTPRKSKDDESEDGGESGRASRENSSTLTGRSAWPTMSSITNRYRSRSRIRPTDQSSTGSSTWPNSNNGPSRFLQPPLWPARPPPAVTPVSRTDTASADSTVYAVRYHPLTETGSHTTDHAMSRPPLSRSNSSTSSRQDPGVISDPVPDAPRAENASAKRWRSLALSMPFNRGSRALTDTTEKFITCEEESTKWDIRNRLEDFAMSQAEKLREKIRPTVNTENLPVRVIPAPARRGAALAQVLEEEEHAHAQAQPQVQRSDGGAAGTSQTPVGTSDPTAPALWRSISSASESSGSDRGPEVLR